MKITIVGGAGGVGASVAFNLLLIGGHDVVIADRRPEMVVSHVMDLEQVLTQGGGSSIRAGDASDAVDADVLVVAAAVPLTVNESRLVYLKDNARILGTVVDALPAGWQGVLVVVTNPVDPLVTWAQQRSGIDRRRVVGYTLNDNLRLRSGIANVRGVAPSSVDAWVVGEHGDSCVPLWDRVRIGGRDVELDDGERTRALEFLRTWYVRHVAIDSNRSSTWTSGLGVARMVDALCAGTPEPWPASLVLEGEYGVDGVALSAPVTLGPAGVREVQAWRLTPDQLGAMARSAALVRELTDRLRRDEPG